mgnify:CR=1 FL=1
MATELFSILTIQRASNQSILSLRLASTTADLIPYSIEQDMEGQTPVLPGWIQVLVTSLIRMSCVDRSYFIPALASYSWWISKKSEATSQAKIYDCGIWWLPARYEILSLLKCRKGMECNWLFKLVKMGKSLWVWQCVKCTAKSLWCSLL